jgi:hypothetical protein
MMIMTRRWYVSSVEVAPAPAPDANLRSGLSLFFAGRPPDDPLSAAATAAADGCWGILNIP